MSTNHPKLSLVVSNKKEGNDGTNQDKVNNDGVSGCNHYRDGCLVEPPNLDTIVAGQLFCNYPSTPEESR